MTQQMQRQTVEITPAKGRPFLHWVGKKPLERVTAFPAQLVETFNPSGEPGEGNLLFHGDNKEVLAYLLANGYRGKVNLIYIDPPFDSGADYVRKVELRGQSGAGKLDGEGHTLGEQIQYTDIWANDNYLQFMYERLLLLKELLAEDGSLYVHMNDSRIAPIRCVMDEVFGPDNFRNLIVWYFTNKIPDSRKKLFTNSTEFILFYSKGENQTFRTLETERDKQIRVSKMEKVEGKKIYTKDEVGKGIYIERRTRIMDNVWNIPLLHAQPEREDYPTQKPMVDCVMVDTAYDGQVFNIAHSDMPEKKSDLVAGHYDLSAPDGPTTVAVKIIDMLGEEVLVTAQV